MKKHFIQVIYWLALVIPVQLSGQSAVLDQYITEALANNLQMRNVELASALQASKVAAAEKLWNPNVDLQASYLLAEGGRLINFPIGDLFNPVYGTLNDLTASQSFPENLENISTQLTPNNFVDASIAVSKPLVNSTIKYNIKIQKELMALYEVDKRIQENEIRFQVRQAYYNLLRVREGKEVLQQNMSLLNEVLAFNEKLIKYDKATPDAISDVQFRIADLESQLSELEEQERLASTLFNIVLNRQIDEEIVVDTTVYSSFSTHESNLNVLIGTALSQRPEFEKILIANDLNALNVERVKNQNNPTIGLRAGIGIQTEDFSLNDGGPLYTLGLNAGWKIIDGGLKKKQLEELLIERSQNDLQKQILRQQVVLQVSESFHTLKSLYAQIKAQDEKIRSANISYEAVSRKYRNEKALLIELLTAQNQWISSRLNRVILMIEILNAQAQLDKVINAS